MRLSKPFTMPEEDPVVPERLAERVTLLLPHATKIVLTEHNRAGSRVVNTVYLDGDEEASDVYTVVKAAADNHAAEVGRSGKYRAQIWRHLPGKVDPERHVVTFHVREDYEDGAQEAEEQDRQDRASGWRDLVEGYHRFAELMAEQNQRATDRVLEQSRQDAEKLNPLADVFCDFVGIYRDGLRMQAASVREVGELRVRQQVAESQAQESGKIWETFAPAVQIAAMHAGKRFLGGGAPSSKALPSAPAAAKRCGVESVEARPSAPSTPPAEPPRSSPPTSPAAAEAPSAPAATLHELAAAVLDNMGADAIVRLVQILSPEQVGHIQAITSAKDDDSSADAILGLMQSLMGSPAVAVAVQQALAPEYIAALQQVSMLAQQHVRERAARNKEGAPPSSGDAPSPGKDGSAP